MSGKLYGVGIGPGDPELLTLKAYRILKEADIIAFPGEIPEETVAFDIIGKIVDLSGKQLLGLSFPMTKNKEELEKEHDKGAAVIESYLKQDKTIAFPTLGDPCVYSTYFYIHKRIIEREYEAEIIPGITSFCAAAAMINESLAETDRQLHIIPSAYGIEEALKLPGTKVLMKACGKYKEVYRQAKESGQDVWCIQNLGMKNERILFDADEEEIENSYYTLFIVKER